MENSSNINQQSNDQQHTVGTWVTVLHAKLLLVTLASQVEELLPDLAANSNPVPCKCAWEGNGKWLKCLAPATHVGGQHGIPASYFWPGPVQDVAVICGVVTSIWKCSLSGTLPFKDITLFQKKKNTCVLFK